MRSPTDCYDREPASGARRAVSYEDWRLALPTWPGIMSMFDNKIAPYFTEGRSLDGSLDD